MESGYDRRQAAPGHGRRGHQWLRLSHWDGDWRQGARSRSGCRPLCPRGARLVNWSNATGPVGGTDPDAASANGDKGPRAAWRAVIRGSHRAFAAMILTERVARVFERETRIDGH